MDSQLVYHRGDLRPRAAVFTKEVQGNAVPNFATRDLVAAYIKCGEDRDQKPVMVRSAYFLSDSVEMKPPTEFKELLQYCSEKKLELLFGRDANAHHTIRGSSDVNPRGRIHVSIIVQNKGKVTIFITKVRKELLDLKICSIQEQK